MGFFSKLRSRLTGCLDHASAPCWAAVAVPLLFALASVFVIGQDANWDLLNYHLYNAYALLNGRVGIDLAPAAMQSYFNPVLDLPYFLMIQHWPPRAIAFAMGLFHGLNFVFLLLIVKPFVERAKHPNATVILLALAGCLSAVFVSELGNTMGDNTSSVFVLAGVAVAVTRWGDVVRARGHYLLWIMLAGLLIGMGAGAKLTNAVYAVAGALALLLACPGGAVHRLRVASAFSAGVVLGIALTGGYWFLMLWELYGNPLFPQFNTYFQSDMAGSIGVGDTRWRPKGVAEALFFPFIFALNPARVGESALYQIALPVLYSLFALWAIAAIRTRFFSLSPARNAYVFPLEEPSRAHFLLAFAATSYLTWLGIFSIHRYLVPLEMIAPLAIWLLLHRLFKPALAQSLGKKVLLSSVIVVLLFRTTWGNVGFGETAFRVELPPLAQPEKTAVMILQGGKHAWLIPFFPPEIEVASLASFPESPKFVSQAMRMIDSRSENAYVIFEASKDTQPAQIAKINRVLASMGVGKSGFGCDVVRWGLKRNSRLNAKMSDSSNGAYCGVVMDSAARRDLAEEDKAIARASDELAKTRYGLRVDLASCVTYRAWVGNHQDGYQYCRISRQS
ncbi:hypothetical protein [Polaromonas sp. JS666]|uniref:hypothetical protein n=1 Tax=Polaromonas sp. (strain JS666 / ATCC BAA-500) TaxID=296591 RepID=UPI0000531DD2|nr:hypothetical protein [Polaromonas sp. JS666]ABE47294.1 conserved hypothetical protein [Polaromonas sp. JS666]